MIVIILSLPFFSYHVIYANQYLKVFCSQISFKVKEKVKNQNKSIIHQILLKTN